MAIKSVGTTLREARQKHGFTLEEIGARTRITAKCLAALEADDVSKLSSPFFYRSFVRQYAEQVDLDVRQLTAGVEQLAATMREPDLPGQGEHQMVRIAPIQPRVKRDLSWVFPTLVFVVAVVGISAAYTVMRHSQPDWLKKVSVSSLIPSWPAPPQMKQATRKRANDISTLSIRKRDTSTSLAEPTVSVAATTPEPNTSSEPARGADQSAPDSDANANGATAGPTLLADAEPGIDAATHADGGIHLELAANERTWLSVIADGKPAYTGILEKEETKVLDGLETAKIRTGNAAGVSITFNGKPIGVIGPRGTTRTVVFTKTSFEVIPQANHPQFTRVTRIGG